MGRPTLRSRLLVGGLLVLIGSFGCWLYAGYTPVIQEEAFWKVFAAPPLEESFQPLGDLLDEAERLLAQNHLDEAQQRFEAARLQLQGMSEAPQVLEARVLDGLGQVAWNYGDFYWALQQHEAARKIYRREGLWTKEADNLEYLAATYTALGEDQLARDRLDEAIEVQPVPWRQAILMMELATLDYMDGDRELAESRMEQAFQMRMAGCDQSEADKLMGKSEVLDRWSGAAMFLGNFEVAMRASQSSLRILERLGYPRELAIGRSNLGVIYHRAGRVDEALVLIDEAIAALPRGAYRHERAILHFRRAQSLRRLGKPLQAIAALERSLAWSESVQAGTSTTALRSAFASRHHIFHDELVDLLLEQQFSAVNPSAGEQAWRVVESVRARDLLHNIRKSSGLPHEDAGFLARWRTLLAELRRLEHQRLQILVDAEGRNPADVEPARQPLADLERRQRDLVLQLQSLEAPAAPPEPSTQALGDGPERPEPPALETLQGLLDDDTVVMQFVLGETHSAIWWLDRKVLKTFRLPPRSELQPVAVQVFDDLADSDQAVDALESEARQGRLETLSQTVLGGLAPQLENQRLVVIADGSLQLLPFSALLHPVDGQPLVLRHPMVYLPSLSVLQALRARRGPDAPLHSATVIADPLYRSKTLQPLGPVTPSRRVSPLPHSRREADAIRRWLGPDGEGLFFLGSEAQQRVLANPERHKTALIHLSVHGELDLARPEFSHLVFALWDEADRPLDGRLYVHEVTGLDLSSELMVLSACNTARGDIVSGEGLVGMPYAVLGAGAQRALLSLWFVDDEATALLMETFYELLLGQRLPPDEALRQAQAHLRSRDDGKWDAPYYWAGFVLYGDWSWPYLSSP